MSRAPGAVLSVVCSSCLQAFHLQSGPFTQKQWWPSSEFVSVLQPVLFCPNHSPSAPRAAAPPRQGGEREKERGRERKREREREREREEKTRRDKKDRARRIESLYEREERANLRGGRRERMTKCKDGWMDLFGDGNRERERKGEREIERERHRRLNHSTFSDSLPMERTSKDRIDSMTGCRRRETEDWCTAILHLHRCLWGYRKSGHSVHHQVWLYIC